MGLTSGGLPDQLDLSGNTLGEAAQYLSNYFFTQGCVTSFQSLGLDRCQIPAYVMGPLLSAISYERYIPQYYSVFNSCRHLSFLSLPGNILTGCLPKYTPQPILRELDISNAGLNNDDLLHLISLVENNKFLQLQGLWLVRNDLQDMTHLLERLVEAVVTHYQRELVVLLFQTNLSESLQKRLTSLCGRYTH